MYILVASYTQHVEDLWSNKSNTLPEGTNNFLNHLGVIDRKNVDKDISKHNNEVNVKLTFLNSQSSA